MTIEPAFHLIINPTFDRGAYKYYSNDHSFEVWSRLANTDDPFVKRDIIKGDTIKNHPPGLYEFAILGKSYLGYTSRIESVPKYLFNVTNPTDPPADVDFVLINHREVYWGYADPPDDFVGFILRYHNQAGKTSWEDGIQPHQGILTHTSFYTNLIPLSARVIMVRAIDAFGVVSTNSGFVFKDAGNPEIQNVVEQFDYHPTFPGTKTNCTVSGSDLVANDNGSLMYTGVPTDPMYDGGAMYGTSYQEMTYQDTFTTTVAGDLLLGVDLDDNGYVVEFKLQSATEWVPVPDISYIVPGDYDIRITIFGGGTRGTIREFSVIIDVPDIKESHQDVSILAAGTRVPPTNSYSVITIVNVIIQDDGVNSPIGYRIFDKNPTLGPLIKLFDAADNAVDGLVDVEIKGY